jgi:hypothetical protein
VTALVLAAAAVGWFVRPGDARSGGTSVRFLLTPTDPPLTIGSLNRAIAITRDGSRLLYYAGRGPTRALYERRLDDALAPPTLLRQGERFFELFVSPDGSWIGFNDESDLTLKKMPARGGPPVPVVAAEKEITGGLWGITGAAWAPDNTIVYGLNSGNFGLWRVAASGGPPERLTTPDKARGELAHGWPAVLPGGRALLYTVRSEVRENPFQIWCKDLRTGAEKSLLTGAGPRYAAGYLVYGIEGDIWAAPFDPEQLKVVGDAVRLVEGVYSHERGRVDFDVSDDGTLVYVTTAVPAPRRLVWLDRARGTVRTPIDAPQRLYSAVRISGDGAQAALVVGDQATDIFLLDFAGPSLRQLTADRAIETSPTWTRDGRLLFSSNRSGRTNIYVQSAIGGPATQLTDNDRASLPNAILPDGRLLYQESHPRTTADLMLWAFETKAEPVGLVEDPNGQMNGRLSADAGWLAYQSDERYFGVREIFVRPFPVAAGQQVQVTSAGGVQPAWARRTNELFYLSNGDLFASTVRVGAAPTVPQLVAKGPFQGFDVGADGRILVIEEVSSAPAAQSVGVVVNWIDRLRSGRRRQPDRLR